MTTALRIIPAHTTDHTPAVRQIFIEYQQWLNFSLCFQGFDKELAELPGTYSPPNGRIYIALYDEQIAGCIALRPMNEQGICEMKRLFVREEFRGKGIASGTNHRRCAGDRLPHNAAGYVTADGNSACDLYKTGIHGYSEILRKSFK
jgi:GNAT superfamily N-acetyltransferase